MSLVTKYNIEFDNELDSDGDMGVEVPSAHLYDPITLYLTKEDAEDLVEHLIKVFKLEL